MHLPWQSVCLQIVAMHRATISSYSTFIWNRTTLFIFQKDAAHVGMREQKMRKISPLPLSPSGAPVQWATWISVGGGLKDDFSEQIRRLSGIDLISYKHKKMCQQTNPINAAGLKRRESYEMSYWLPKLCQFILNAFGVLVK